MFHWDDHICCSPETSYLYCDILDFFVWLANQFNLHFTTHGHPPPPLLAPEAPRNFYSSFDRTMEPNLSSSEKAELWMQLNELGTSRKSSVRPLDTWLLESRGCRARLDVPGGPPRGERSLGRETARSRPLGGALRSRLGPPAKVLDHFVKHTMICRMLCRTFAEAVAGIVGLF